MYCVLVDRSKTLDFNNAAASQKRREIKISWLGLFFLVYFRARCISIIKRRHLAARGMEGKRAGKLIRIATQIAVSATMNVKESTILPLLIPWLVDQETGKVRPHQDVVRGMAARAAVVLILTANQVLQNARGLVKVSGAKLVSVPV